MYVRRAHNGKEGWIPTDYRKACWRQAGIDNFFAHHQCNDQCQVQFQQLDDDVPFQHPMSPAMSAWSMALARAEWLHNPGRGGGGGGGGMDSRSPSPPSGTGKGESRK